MKRTLLLLSAAAAALLSIPASAQDENNAPRANPPESSRPDYSRERPARAGAAGDRLHSSAKANDVIGMTVINYQDEKLGTVQDLAVVVSAGGFLGMGDELSAVPPAALSFSAGRDALQLDATKEQMAAAPHFKAGQWPDFNQAMYSESVYRAYKQEPYFSTNTMTGADNTGRNVRDRDERNLTPQDQGNSRTDTDLTAQIRRGINDRKDMSVNAKNVKIITAQGRVTLRGPVATAEEKRMIGEIASGLARPENVDNQLEVK